MGSSNVVKNDIVNKIQNRVLRIITNTKRTHRAWEKLEGLNILPINDLYKLEVSKFCHKHIYGKLPSSFEEKVMPNLSIMTHSVSTRHSDHMNYHFNITHNLPKSNKSFTADCVRIWNAIPFNIKKQSSPKIYLYL